MLDSGWVEAVWPSQPWPKGVSFFTIWRAGISSGLVPPGPQVFYFLAYEVMVVYGTKLDHIFDFPVR